MRSRCGVAAAVAITVLTMAGASEGAKPKAKAKGRGMEAEFVRIDENGSVTIGKGAADGVVKGCVVHANARIAEFAAEKGTAAIFVAKALTDLRRDRTLELTCGRIKVKATVTGVEAAQEKGARVRLGGLKGKKIDKECTHSFLLGRVDRVYERASVVPRAATDAIAAQKTFWVQCP